MYVKIVSIKTFNLEYQHNWSKKIAEIKQLK